MRTHKKGVPPMPSLGGDGTGMDQRVTIERYIVCEPFPTADSGVLGYRALTDKETAAIDPDTLVGADFSEKEWEDILASPMVSPDYKGHIDTPDWIIWEGVDGALHIGNGRDPKTQACLGEIVTVPRSEAKE